MSDSTFKTNMAVEIVLKIKANRREGITAMSPDNLWAVLAQRISRMQGSPQGTNGTYIARQMFDEALADLPGKYRGDIL